MVALTEGDDVLVELIEGDVTIDALGGDDVVNITNDDPDDDVFNAGAVQLDGGSGDDDLSVYATYFALLHGRDGDDRLYSDAFDGAAYGGAGDDVITVFSFDDESDDSDTNIFGEEGDDVLINYSRGESYGGSGSDHVIGGTWFLVVSSGEAGDDVVEGEVGQAGDGSDYVRGVYIEGNAGNDVLLGLSEAKGGAGRDVFVEPFLHNREYQVADFTHGEDHFAIPVPVTVVDAFTGQANQAVNDGTDTVFDLDGDGTGEVTWVGTGPLVQDDFLTTILHVSLDDFMDDVVTGTALDEFAYGGDGDDELSGGGGEDEFFGGFGEDSLSGNSGDDLLVGNAGDDRAYGGSGDDELDGGDGDDTLSASTGNDYAYGGDGDDLIAGGDGADWLLGQWGDDRLNGGAGNDTLDGGEGDDTLIGGAGKDTLTGGEGADKFLFMPGDSRPGGGVRDVVTDFTTGEDVLDLRALGVMDAAAQISYQAIGTGVILRIDLDGDGVDAADFALQLTGVSSLAAGDMLL